MDASDYKAGDTVEKGGGNPAEQEQSRVELDDQGDEVARNDNRYRDAGAESDEDDD